MAYLLLFAYIFKIQLIFITIYDKRRIFLCLDIIQLCYNNSIIPL